MKILNDRQVRQKIKRLATEILENNFEEPVIILAGINNNGMAFALLLMEELRLLTKIPVVLTRIRLNPANPVGEPVRLEMDAEELKDKSIIVVDDVANTGRTMFYAFRPLLEVLPKKVETAVLVDRTHKSFPVEVNYVGMSLATTLLEDIDVRIRDTAEFSVELN